MLKRAVGIHRDYDVSGDGLTGCWSPSDLGGGHLLLHLGVQNV
jgi:hypothetical protein